MAALTDTTIASTYKQLLKITSEGVGADASAKYVEDGLGTDTALSLSTTRVGIGTASPAKPLHISSGDHSLGATYEAFYIGVGGDVSLDCATSGSNIVFKNVASGQLLPVRATVVNQTGTTATDIVALKA